MRMVVCHLTLSEIIASIKEYIVKDTATACRSSCRPVAPSSKYSHQRGRQSRHWLYATSRTLMEMESMEGKSLGSALNGFWLGKEALLGGQDISKATNLRNVEQEHISACIVRTRLGEARRSRGRDQAIEEKEEKTN